MDYKVKRIIYGDGRVVYELWEGFETTTRWARTYGLHPLIHETSRTATVKETGYTISIAPIFFRYTVVFRSLCEGEALDMKRHLLELEKAKEIISCKEVL